MFERYTEQQKISEGERYHELLLDSVDIQNPDYEGDLERVKKPAQKGSGLNYYVSFKDALDLARHYQPRDKNGGRVKLNNPRKEFLDDLRWEVIENLGLKSEEERDKLMVYTVEGSPMDYLHGTDFVVDFDGKIVTVDITLKSRRGGKKASVVVAGELPGPNDKKREQEYEQRVNEIGRQIAAKFLREDFHGPHLLTEKEKKNLLE